MTVSSTASRVVLAGDGSNTVWPFAFKVQQPADLVVVYTDATGTDVTLTTGQYDATGFGQDAGGTVTYPAGGSGKPAIAAIPAPPAGVRQTVAGGPVDANGLPAFWPSSATGLTLATQNVGSSHPLAATAANGFSATSGLAVDVPGWATGTLSWTAANGSTVYAYATIGTNGAMTPGTTTLAPIYQWGGTPGTANGQFTFNISEMRGYMGNGTAAPQASIVFFGEITASGGNVTGVVMYAYNGRYDSGFTATLPAGATAVSKSHNIGTPPRLVDFIIECVTAEGGYSVGDQLSVSGGLRTNDGAGNFLMNSVKRTAKTVAVMSSTATNAWATLNWSTGAGVALTNANWKYKLVASRGY